MYITEREMKAIKVIFKPQKSTAEPPDICIDVKNARLIVCDGYVYYMKQYDMGMFSSFGFGGNILLPFKIATLLDSISYVELSDNKQPKYVKITNVDGLSIGVFEFKYKDKIPFTKEQLIQHEGLFEGIPDITLTDIFRKFEKGIEKIADFPTYQLGSKMATFCHNNLDGSEIEIVTSAPIAQ